MAGCHPHGCALGDSAGHLKRQLYGVVKDAPRKQDWKDLVVSKRVCD